MANSKLQIVSLQWLMDFDGISGQFQNMFNSSEPLASQTSVSEIITIGNICLGALLHWILYYL